MVNRLHEPAPIARVHTVSFLSIRTLDYRACRSHRALFLLTQSGIRESLGRWAVCQALAHALSLLQGNNPAESSPIRLALVTARSMPAHERVIRTLHAWNVRIDEAFFMGGVSKTPIRQTFNPHIDFDDQEIHCDPASKVVPTARVPLLLRPLAGQVAATSL